MNELSRRELLHLAAGLAAAAALPAQEDAMILIPAGRARLGTPPDLAARLADMYDCHVSWLVGEEPREVELPAFRIDRTPVTGADYAAFITATGARRPMGWRENSPPPGLGDHPVTGIDHAMASAYAAWAGKRLPREDEWEYAARGPESLIWPWGNRFDAEACVWNRKGLRGPTTEPADSYPQGASPFGCLHMAGQVAEWCADQPIPQAAAIRGGCWQTATPLTLRGACRIMSGWANNSANFYGFRCAADA